METIKRYTSAVIVSAGNSLRMKCKKNKNYLHIGEFAAVSLTLHAFDSCSLIDEIVLVYKTGEENLARLAAKEAGLNKKITLTQGGESRTDSVYNGLMSVDKKCTHVAIHDGARALITPNDITEVLLECYRCGAATLADKLTDTLCQIKTSNNQTHVSHYINRSEAALIQTPQCFEYPLIMKAHQNAQKHRSEITDDTRLVSEMGQDVHLVFCKNKNLKITEPEDLYIAKALIHQRIQASRQETEE